MAASARKFETLEAFLRWERKQTLRHEWDRDWSAGAVTAMTGTRIGHNRIVQNLARVLDALPALRDCFVGTESIKVRIGKDALFYPDVVVNCPEPPHDTDIAPNPIIIAEVLSDSTASIDRGRKWFRYQTLSSLRHFLLVAQDAVRVEVYDRDGTNWRYRIVQGRRARVALDAIGASLAMADIYERTDIGAHRRRGDTAP